MSGTTPLVGNDEFKNLFEKFGAAGAAQTAPTPSVTPLPPSRVRATPLPTPAPLVTKDEFDKLAGDHSGEGDTGTNTGIDPAQYKFQPKLGQDNDLLRAQNQGFFEKAGKTIANTVANVPLDLLQSIGYTAELLASDHSYNNAGEDAIDKLKNPFGEVYRQHPDKTFDLADPAWWMNNIGGFAEGTAQFIIPGEAEAAGIGGLTKGIAAGLNLSKDAVEVMQGAGQVLSSAHMGYLMAAQSGRQMYESTYDTNYHRGLAQGLDPESADQRAKQVAANAAATTVQLGTALNSVFGLAALSPMFRNNENKLMQWLETNGSRQEGETLEGWKQRLSQAASDPELQQAMKQRPGGIMSSYPAQALQIGLMGVSSEYADKAGKEVAQGKSRDNLDYVQDFFDKVSDQEGALNFLTGIIGGPVHGFLADHIPIHQVLTYDDSGKPIVKQDTDGKTIYDDKGNPKYVTQRVSARTRDELGNQVFFNSMRDAINKDVDWYSGKNDELRSALSSGKQGQADQVRQEMFNVANLNAISMGMGDNWKKTYRDIASLDNTQDLGQQMQPQIDALGQQIEQATQQGQDATPLQQQLEQLQASQKEVAGKTEAQTKGFSRGVGDDEYKMRANRAVENLDWMKKSYDSIRQRYVSLTDPISEQLAYHVFAREAENHLMEQTLDDEQTSIERDKGLLDSLQTYQQSMAVSDRVRRGLQDDVIKMQQAVEDNDIDSLRKLAGKYRVPAYGDTMIRKGVEETVDKLREEMDRHTQDRETAHNALLQDSGYEKWKLRNPDSNFQDYLDHIAGTRPIDDRIAEREANLEQMRTELAIRKENLDRVKSARGIEAFKTRARKDFDRWKKETEEKNMHDNIHTFMDKQDKVAAQRIKRMQMQGEIGRVHQRILHHIDNENRIKTEIDRLRAEITRPKYENNRSAEKLLNLRHNLARLESELTGHEKARAADAARAQQLSSAIQETAQQETAQAALTRDQADNVDEATPEAAPVLSDQPNDEEEATTTETPPPSRLSPVEQYVAMKGQLREAGSIYRAVNNLEFAQDPENYSYDLTKAALQPFVEDGTISEDMAHEIMVAQKAYLDDETAQMGRFNSLMDSGPDTPVPPAVPVMPVEEPTTVDDITGPSEPFSPIVNMSPSAVATPEEADKIDQAIGAKAFDSLKVNTAAIQYMEVTRHPKGKPSFHAFLPLYDKLDPDFNRNVLKPGFIKTGDKLRFEVDKHWEGKINYDSSIERDDYGMPVKRADKYSDYVENGKVRMEGEGYTYQNVPIKIIHEGSGETIGYLPRTDWVTAQVAENAYRNIVDVLKNEEGEETPGNVDAQVNRLLNVRRMIVAGHNDEREPIRSSVTDRASGGHPFLSTDVNRNTERSKLVPKTAKTLLPDPKLKFGLLNKGTIYTGYQTPLEGGKNFTDKDIARYGKPGQEANNIPMVVLPMPNGRVSVSPLYTKSLGEHPSALNTIARAIEAHLAAGTPSDNPRYQKWRDKIGEATGAGGTKALDITDKRDLESFINQYYTYTQHFRESDTAFDAKVQEGTTKKPRFMLDLEEGDKGGIKVGTSWSGEKPIRATLTPDGKLDPAFEEALREGLSTHYKNVVYTRGDLRGLNDERPFHSITIKADGNTRIDKHDNYNEFLKTFSETIIYGKHQAGDGTYLYGANPIVNFDYGEVLRSGQTTEAESTVTPDEEDDIFNTMLLGSPKMPGDKTTNAADSQQVKADRKLEDIIGTDPKVRSVQSIHESITSLYTEASQHPDVTFNLDLSGNPKERIYLGDRSYLSMTQLAGMMDRVDRPIPYNIKLSDDFMSILQNTPRRFLNNLLFEDSSRLAPLPYDEEILGKQIEEMFVPVRDANGNKTGVFDAERQTDVADNIVQAVKLLMDSGKGPSTIQGFKEMIKNNVFKSQRDKYDRIAAGGKVPGMEGIRVDQASNLRDEYDKVLRSFDSPDGVNFWDLTMDKLKAYGIHPVDNGHNKTGEDQDNDVMPQLTADGTDPLTPALEAGEAHGLRDWSDVSFETDPKDTATGRLKMFLATTPDSRVGEEDTPRQIELSFSDPAVRRRITQGAKDLTTRTPDQARKLGLQEGKDVVAVIDGKMMRVTPLTKLDEDTAALHEGIGKEEGTIPQPGDWLLQMKPYLPKQNVLSNNKNYLGLAKLADYEQLFEKVISTLADTPRDFDRYIQTLKDAGNQFNPNLRALAERLEKAPVQVRNEFTSVVSLQYQPFSMVLLDNKRDSDGRSYQVLRTIEANRGSQVNALIDSWQQNQKFAPILKRNAAGITVVDQSKAAMLHDQLKVVNALYEKGEAQAPDRAVALFRSLLNANGITLPEEAIQQFIAAADKWTKKTSVSGNFRRQFAVSDRGEPLGIISTMILKLAGREASQDDEMDNIEDKSFMLTNPLYTEKTAVSALARLAAAHTPQLYSNTHRSSEGKNIYDYGFNTALSRKVQSIKGDQTFRDQFGDVDIAKRSWLLGHLNNDPLIRERLQLSYLDGLKVAYMPSASGVVRPEMSDREQLLTSIGMFINQGNEKYAHYLSLTHSDKSTTPVFRNAPRIRVVTSIRTVEDRISKQPIAVMTLSDEALGHLHNVFYSEYDRIQRAAQVGDYNNPKYEKGAEHFYFLPTLNYDAMKKGVADGVVPAKVFEKIWVAGEHQLNVKEAPGMKEAVQWMISRHVDAMTNNTLAEWNRNGIIQDGNTPFDRRYINRLLSGVNINTVKESGGKISRMDRSGQSIDDKTAHNLASQLAARDYAVNHYLMNVSMSQLLYGDPAQAWKGSVDKTMVEYGKRLAKDIAPGRELAFKPGETYRSITARDWKTSAPYLAEIESLKKYYAEGHPLESTDAQEITTVQEHLDVMHAAGRIDDKVYRDMSKIISDAKGGYYAFTDPLHQKVILQPQKPVYVGDRPPINGAILNDYIKSSSYPLYPPFLAGKELDKVRVAMEHSGLARLNFESAHKLGTPTTPAELFDSQGRFKEGALDDQKAWQQLSRDNFRIQQEVPYDEDKDSIRTVSQMNKLITQGLPLIKTPFNIGGRSMSAAEVMHFKEDTRKALFDQNMSSFLNDIGGERNNEGDIQVKDMNKLFDTLQQKALEGNLGFTANDVAYLKQANRMPNSDELVIPLMYAPSAPKFEAMLMSMVSDIGNVKMPGKSYIQASPAGHESVKKWEDMGADERKNIVWVGDYKGGALKTVRPSEDGKRLLPAEVFVPWRFKGRLEDFLVTNKEGQKVLDPSRVPSELLDMVGARIPNQGHNSMLPLTVAGFVPPNMGDLVIVPAAITKQMGADFDVDKLYAYMRAYQEKRQILAGPDSKAGHANIKTVADFQTLKEGSWTGTTENAETKKTMKAQIAAGDEKIGGTGETAHQFEDRVLPAWRHVLDNAPANSVVTTHSSVFRLIEQFEEQGRPGDNRVDLNAYNNRAVTTGDVISFEGKNGRIFVARHGETEDNKAGLWRRPDTPLTDKGVTQAREAGQQIKEQTGGQVGDIYSSSLQRAIHSSNLMMDEITGETNVKGPIFERSQTDSDVLKNDYFDIHHGVLTHPEMLQHILNPLDKDDLKLECALIEKWEAAHTNIKPTYYDPVYQLRDFQAQKDAKRLVALASLSVTFNSVIQDKNLRPGQSTMDDDGNKKQEIVPLYLIDEHGKRRVLSTLSGYGQSAYTDGAGSPVQVRSKHDNHTTVQSEVVDYAKNKVSDKVHLSTYTYPASAALTQLQEPDGAATAADRKLLGEGRGWAAHLGYNARLLSQPIIQEYVAELAKRGDSLSGEFTPDLKDAVARAIAQGYLQRAADAGEKELASDHAVSYKDLTESLRDPTGVQSFNAKQLAALNLFRQLDQVGGQMTRAQSTINHDTRGAGSTLLETFSKEVTRNNLEMMAGKPDELKLLGVSDLYSRHTGGVTEQGHLYNLMLDASEGVVGELFPYREMMSIFDYLMQHTNRQDLSIDTQKNVFNSVKSFIFTHPQLGFWDDPQVTRANLLYRRGGDPSLADRIQEAKQTWGQNNYFLQRLAVDVDPDNVRPSYVSYQASKASRLDDYENTKAWLDMFLSADDAHNKLAEDLVRYTYLTGGLQDARSFVKYVPYSYLVGTDFGHKLRELTGNIENVINKNPNFKEQWFQHNPQFAKSLSPKLTELGSEVEKYPESLSLPVIDKENPSDPNNPASALVVQVKGENGFYRPAYPDYLSYRSKDENRWILYKKLDMENYYTRIDTLGDKDMDEYSLGDSLARRSLIPENRSRAYDNIEPAARMVNNFIADKEVAKAVENFGIAREGNEAHMVDILRNISTDKSIPTHQRIVAEFLSQLRQGGPEGELRDISGWGKDRNFSYEVVKGEGSSAGDWESATKTLHLFTDNINTKAELAETINHEMIHSHTSLITELYDNDDALRRLGYDDDGIKHVRKMADRFAEKYPEQAKEIKEAMKDLHDMRTNAVEKFEKYMQDKGIKGTIDEHYDRIKKSGLDTDIDHVAYALSSDTEFITGALTNEVTMRWLNNQSYDGKGKGFLGGLKDIVKRVMLAIGKAFGVKTGSLLESALDRSLNVMTLAKTVPISPEDMIDITRNMKIHDSPAINTATMRGLDRVIGKLNEQKGALMDSLTGRLPKEEVADKQAKIDDIEADIDKLEHELSTDMIITIGEKHLGWVDKVIRNEVPNSQVMTASRVLETWENLVELLYGDEGAGEVDSNFANLYAQAKVARSNLTRKMERVYVNTSDNVIGMRDFNTQNLKDIGWIEGGVRSLSSAATSKVSQYIATFMENTARHRDEDVLRNTQHMQALEKRMADLAGGKHNLPNFYHQFFQDNATHDAWGLVQRFHQDWYDYRRGERDKLQQALRNIDAEPTATTAEKGLGKQRVWQNYWKRMNENSVFADTRLLFDRNTGAPKDDPTARMHREALESAIGKDAADELVEDAHQRYGKYLDVKQAYFDDLDGEVAAGDRPQDESDRLKTEWVSKYSPNVFFNNFKNPVADFKGMNSDYYVRNAPRRTSLTEGKELGFYDQKFEDIQHKPEVKKVYDEINSTLQTLKDSLPTYVQQNMGKNFMPVVAKSLFADMVNPLTYVKHMGRRFINDLTASATEEMEANNSWNKLPLRYIQDDRKNLPLEMRSRDIPRMMEAFGLMALHYKHFADAKDYIDMGETILREIDKVRASGASQVEQNGELVTVNDGLRNTLNALKYMKDFLMYKKSRALEGKSETMLYSPDIIKNAKITHQVKDLIVEREKLEQQIIDGEIEPGAVAEKLATINARIAEFGGRRLYGSKVGDKLIGINQLKTLSYNPFSSIANVGFGIVSAAIHANGGADFSWKHFAKAAKIMTQSMAKWATVGSKESVTAGKILAIMDRAGIIGDVIDSHYGKIKTREREPGWQKSINPYNWMRSGDFYMKGLTTVAMMLHDTVKVNEGGVEKEISLWEAHNNDGQWDTKRFGENKAWQSDDVNEQKEFDKFRNKAIRLNMIIHGNQDKNSPKLVNKFILGRLIGQFRMSWLPEGWYSRFEKERYDIQLGRETKGRYTTIKDLGLLGYAKVTLRQLASIVSKVDPYTGIRRLDGKAMSDTDVNNMRRNFAELGFIAGMAGVVLSLKSLIDPDEDSYVRYSLRILTNQLIRNQQDMEFYASPGVFDAVTRNVIPASDVLKDYWKAMKATARVLTDSDYETSKWLLSLTHAGLPVPQATLINKTQTAATKDLNNLQQ